VGEWIGKNRKARRCYGFDDIALVPGNVTINPAEVDCSWRLAKKKYPVPIIASAMDGVVDVDFAVQMSRSGGIAVLNLEGVQTRYENATAVLKKIAKSSNQEVTRLLQKIYKEPIKEKLIARRIKEIKKRKGIACVSSIPQKAEKYGPIAQSAGCDVFIVQSTVTTTTHISTQYRILDFHRLCSGMRIPVILGNCVTYKTTLDLMDTGASGILVGIGPGAACTTRGVLGLGVPQVTAICDAAAARDAYLKQSSRYVPVIADGGMSTGGDICKAFACGADAVMIGSAFAKTKEAPGGGYHWGMATPHANLPRGTRIKVGITGSLEEILYGPARLDDGTQNLMGALQTCMGNVGSRNIKELQKTEIIIAPAIKTEGKVYQQAQRLGMGKS
jgi:IMP dehydrogenase